nr:monovalent cation/H(+) antiporter subunit G [Thioalkalivibrio sp.]
MIELLTAVFLVAGAGFMLIAALGLLRMPDLLTRMHATTKAGVLGAGLIMVGAAIFIGQLTVVVKAVAVIAFLILTAPVAAHAIGRAGYFMGVPLWSQTHTDELEGRYDPETHILASGPEKPSGNDIQAPRENSDSDSSRSG